MQRGEIDAAPDEPVSHNPAVRKRVLLRKGTIAALTQVARARFPAGEIAEAHLHQDMWELFICERGTGTMVVSGQAHLLSRGSWILVEPGESHELRADKGEELTVTTFGILDS
jgi:quercetin dioxygenase-like cupin family protein